jgi:hypothetical protein
MDKLKKINLGYCTINQKSKVQITITCSQRTLRELILKLKLINLALLKQDNNSQKQIIQKIYSELKKIL